MATGNETVAEILREMRGDAIAADAWCETHGEMASAASVLNRHADRIEAAYRCAIAAKDREIAELRECLKVACDAELSCKECKSPCYVYTQDDCPIKKRWRKALEGVKDGE